MRLHIVAILLPLMLTFAVLRSTAHAESPPIPILAIYAPWYDDTTWQQNITSDLPTPLFHSDDPETIRRDILLARRAGLDGFVSFWIQPGDRTDENFRRLLEMSRGTPFRSAVGFLANVAGNQSTDTLIQALSYIRTMYTGHPNYFRFQGKPVIFFTDMDRVPGSTNPHATWRAIRDRVDPHRDMLWIAEGLDPSYLGRPAEFDGLYVLKITHRDFPNDYVKASQWASRARSYGPTKLWIGTLMPGWDDTRVRDEPGGFRTPSPPHLRDREGGDFLRNTFRAAMASRPDWLLLHSWNEFVEGTYIHPSRRYGDFYLNLTRELLGQIKPLDQEPLASLAAGSPTDGQVGEGADGHPRPDGTTISPLDGAPSPARPTAFERARQVTRTIRDAVLDAIGLWYQRALRAIEEAIRARFTQGL